jgi:ribosomal protein S6
MEEESRPEDTSEQTQANEGKGHEAIYEIGFHLVPTLTEAEAVAALERMHKALGKAEATILAEESPKKINLAYRIERSVAGKREKYTEGYFGFIKFEFSAESETIGESVNALEAMLRGDSHVLRYLLIKTTREAPVAPKAIFSSRSLEGRTIGKPVAQPEERGEVDEGELDKSIEALVGEESKE